MRPFRSRASSPSVLVLTSEYAPYAWGGLATYVHEIVRRLPSRGVSVGVAVAPTYARAVPRMPVAGLPPAVVVDLDRPAAATVDELDACLGAHDVVYAQDANAARVAAGLLERGICRRIVAAAHLPSYSGFSYFDKPADDVQQQCLEALLFRHANRVVAPSRFAADVLMQVHRLHPGDIAVIPLGVPPGGPRPTRYRGGRPLRCASVGRIAKQKGLEDLCAIAALVPPDVATFTHYGAARVPSDAGALAAANVTVRGQLAHADLLRELSQADVLVSTSMYETFGLALAEAMAAGVVPVAYDCGALLERFDDDVEGVLIEMGDPGAAAAAIVDLHRDGDRLARLSRAAVERAAQCSWDTHVDELSDVLLAG